MKSSKPLVTTKLLIIRPVKTQKLDQGINLLVKKLDQPINNYLTIVQKRHSKENSVYKVS